MTTTLGFDTATGATVAGLVRDRELLAERFEDSPGEGHPRHAELLLPAIEAVVEEGGGWPSIDRIAVGVGPGTYTGMRIAVVTARALARAHGLVLAGVPTPEALALDVARQTRDPACGVLDGKRSEVFWSLARAGEIVEATRLDTPEALADELLRRGFGGVIAGEGAVLYADLFAERGLELGEQRISGRAICLAAADRQFGDPLGVVPRYLREPDADRWLKRDQPDE